MARATAAKSTPKAKARLHPRRSGASSSGHEVDHDSPDSSPSTHGKILVGRYDLDGLAISWDNDPGVRERMREGMHLCLTLDPQGNPSNGHVEPTLEAIKLNQMVLHPIAEVMRQQDLMLPCIDNLIQSVDQLYQLAQLPRSLELCYQEAWAIRRMLVKLKKCLHREYPPQDSE